MAIIQGSTLEVESELDKGSQFSFTIPYIKVAKSEKVCTNYIRVQKSTDDNLMNIITLRKFLVKCKVILETARNDQIGSTKRSKEIMI